MVCTNGEPLSAAFSVSMFLEQRNQDAVLHQRGGLFALGRRNQVDRAHLVLLAPAAPVRKLRHPAIDQGGIYGPA